MGMSVVSSCSSDFSSKTSSFSSTRLVSPVRIFSTEKRMFATHLLLIEFDFHYISFDQQLL